MPKNATISSASTAAAVVAAATRCRTTSRPQASHGRLAVFSCRSRGQSIRGPMPPRIAGSSVVVTSTETSGMSIPPSPMLRSPGTGRTTSATRPMPTVSPENTTASKAWYGRAGVPEPKPPAGQPRSSRSSARTFSPHMTRPVSVKPYWR